MSLADRILGAVLGGLGIICIAESYRIWSGWTGTGVMPFIVGSILLILSGILLVFPSPKGRPIKWPSEKEMFHVGIISGSFALYIALMDYLGYALSTWILLAALTIYISTSQKHPTLSWISITMVWTGAFALSTYIIFKKYLSVYLPAGFTGV